MKGRTFEDFTKEIPQWISKLETTIKCMVWVNEERRALWISELDPCRSPPVFIVALLGGTGAGKSSLINAVLEANIVPTSGNKACTSVITEITYHSNPTEANIDFISKESWKEELRRFLGDIKDDLNEPMSARNADNTINNPPKFQLKSMEGKQAWKTMKIIYPTLELKDLVEDNDTSFLLDDTQWPHLKYLGSTEHVLSNPLNNFASQIKRFVDENGPWPLVRNVKIRCPSKALETGVTLVDLPGVSDSNAARSAISTAYIKRCHHLWIVSPITRAADAQITSGFISFISIYIFLGYLKHSCKWVCCKDSFMRMGNLTYPKCGKDGLYTPSKITFVVTKCDDLNPTEVTDNLSLQDDPDFLELSGTWDASELACEDAESEIQRYQTLVQVMENQEHEHSTQIKCDSMNDTVNPKRRAPEPAESAPAKRVRANILNSQNNDVRVTGQEAHMDEKEMYKSLHRAREALDACKEKRSKADYALRLFCSRKRSEDTREALLARVHEENETDDLEDGNSNIAKVLTVSTWDFLKIKGVMKGRKDCFLDATDTGIPDLQDHCRSLTDPSRARFTRTSFALFRGLILSISHHQKDVEGRDEGSRLELSKQWGTGRPSALRSRLGKAFRTKRENVVEILEENFRKGLHDTCVNAAQEAIDQAHGIAVELQEGMRWQGLRATYRREGVWRIDMNEGLLVPFTGTVLDAWRATLDADYFPDLCEGLGDIIRTILSDLVKSCPETIRGRAKKQAEETLEVNATFLESLQHTVQDELDNQRKETTSLLSPEIRSRLSEGYSGALQFTGKGSVRLQRDFFNSFVDEVKKELFEGLKSILLNGLTSIAQAVGATLERSLVTLAHKVHLGMSNLWETQQQRTPEHDLVEKDLQQYNTEIQRRERFINKWSSGMKV